MNGVATRHRNLTNTTTFLHTGRPMIVPVSLCDTFRGVLHSVD